MNTRIECAAKIIAKGDPEKLFECASLEEMSFDRSSLTVKKKVDGIEFDVKAKDAVALRATLNTIVQLLLVFEGVREIQRNK